MCALAHDPAAHIVRPDWIRCIQKIAMRQVEGHTVHDGMTFLLCP
jgi:hypothetical protein